MNRLEDAHRRTISYLRLSVTDRCNLRCLYCTPVTGFENIPHREILTYEEMTRLTRLCLSLNMTKVRLTGGEPLVRKGILDFVRQLKAMPVPDLRLTTNGILLGQYAGELFRAGVKRVNVSLDTLDEAKYKEITKAGSLKRVWESLETARAVGMGPIKLNVVVIRGLNDNEIEDFARLSLESPFQVRFIEFMPLERNGWKPGRVVSSEEVFDRLKKLGKLEEGRPGAQRRAGPAVQAPGRSGRGGSDQPHLQPLLPQLQPASDHRRRQAFDLSVLLHRGGPQGPPARRRRRLGAAGHNRPGRGPKAPGPPPPGGRGHGPRAAHVHHRRLDRRAPIRKGEPMYKTLRYELDDRTAIITLNRPEIYNALDSESGPELVQALETAGADEGVRVVVLTGQGKAFSAGGNVQAMHRFLLDHPGQGAAPFFFRVVDALHRSVLTMRQMKKPVIAAVNGVAAGGGLGWVLAADLVVASPKARFDTAYIRIAASPDGGNSFFLPRLLGPWRTAELFFLGQAFGAQKAHELGLVNRLVEEDRLMEEALALAKDLAGRSRSGLARTKELINASVWSGLAEHLEKEREYLLASADGPDFEAAIKAFFTRKS